MFFEFVVVNSEQQIFEQTNLRPLQYQLRLHQFLQTNRRDKVCAQCLSDVINHSCRSPTAVFEEGLRRVGQACIAVRDTHGIDSKNPLPFFGVRQRIEAALCAYSGRFVVVPVPNITHVFYGRDVGYIVERIVLDDKIEAFSATQLRRLGAEL
jgi:hypothetical protein